MLVSKEVFDKLGGFTTDYKVAGDVEEFLMNAATAGLTVEVIPEVLAAREASVTRTERLNETGALFRSIRPHLNAVPASFQPLLQDPEPLSGPLWYESRLPMVVALGRRILPGGVRRRLVDALRSRPARPMPPAGDA